jgi:transcriptional regulator with XRE-family HTH domain
MNPMNEPMSRKKPSPEDIEIGRRIRARRLMIGMSQTALAEKLEITFQQVQKYERGTNRISSGRLKKVASFLGVPMNYFYDDIAADTGIAHSIPGFAYTPQAIKLLQAFSTIEVAALRRAVVNLVKTAAKMQGNKI